MNFYCFKNRLFLWNKQTFSFSISTYLKSITQKLQNKKKLQYIFQRLILRSTDNTLYGKHKKIVTDIKKKVIKKRKQFILNYCDILKTFIFVLN